MSSRKSQEVAEEETNEHPTPTCGIIRPIAAIDGCTESHWEEVHNIICEAIKLAGFKPNLVSHASESGIIQKTIIENLYFNEIVVCDISCKNPNVMLELGMRLAFDKPTIVIKDYETPFSFDASPIEHLLYRRDLRFHSIVEFKQKLTSKIQATFEKSKTDQEYSTFLKHFGTFTVAKVEQKEVPVNDFIIESLKSIREEIHSLKGGIRQPANTTFNREKNNTFGTSEVERATSSTNRYYNIVDKLSDLEKIEFLSKIHEEFESSIASISNDEDSSTISIIFDQNTDKILAFNRVNGILNRILVKRKNKLT